MERILIIFLLFFSIAANAERRNYIEIHAFDFDDTIEHTTSSIYIFANETAMHLENAPAKIRIPTEKYAEIGEMVGKPGPYENFNVRDGSFVDFADVPGKNTFDETLQKTHKEKLESDWKAPMWQSWHDKLGDSTTANDIYVITAREQSRDNIYSGFQHEAEEGIIARPPKKENIYPVGGKEWSDKGISIEQAKLIVMRGILDVIEKRVQVEITAGSTDFFGVFEFADDDYQNFKRARDGLLEDISRWPHVKIYISYVGKRHPYVGMHSVDLRKFSAAKDQQNFCPTLFSKGA